MMVAIKELILFMQKNYTQLLLGLLIGLLVGLVLGRYVFNPKKADPTTNTNAIPTYPVTNNSNTYDKQNTTTTKRNSQTNTTQESFGINDIPANVVEVLQYIMANGKPMDGYVGGRTFYNRENQLPMNDDKGNRISYQEWDVHPKVQGQNRGRERIVTGDDGRSWYTNDHYKTFILIK